MNQMIKPYITIDGRKIGPDYPPYIIAELSANHNGDIHRAFAIMEEAKKAGADAIITYFAMDAARALKAA